MHITFVMNKFSVKNFFFFEIITFKSHFFIHALFQTFHSILEKLLIEKHFPLLNQK